MRHLLELSLLIASATAIFIQAGETAHLEDELVLMAIAIRRPKIIAGQHAVSRTTLAAKSHDFVQQTSTVANLSKLISGKSLQAAGSDNNSLQAADKDGSEQVRKQLGVSQNSASDLDTLKTSLAFNLSMSVVYLVVFGFLYRWQPKVYMNNTLNDTAPQPQESWFGLFLTLEQVQRSAGLDAAMLVEFCNLGMKISACLGIPFVLLLCPTYKVLGAEWAAYCTQSSTNVTVMDDPLQSISISVLPSCRTTWFNWLLAGLVWLVVAAVQFLLRRAQRDFVKRRMDWLQARPKPQSTTLMVTNIPPKRCSDASLKAYFDRLFPQGAIERVYVVKKLHVLDQMMKEFDEVEQELQEAHHLWEQCDFDPTKRPMRESPTSERAKPVDQIEDCKQMLATLIQRIQAEQDWIQSSDHENQHAICGSTAFVTFKVMRDSEIAQWLRLEPDGGLFTMEYPPAPNDVRYADLLRNPYERKMLHILGYALIFALFLAFFPLIGLTSSTINLQSLQKIHLVEHILTEMPWLESILEGVFATLVLSMFMAFLPTVLHLIISKTFTLKAEAQSQLYLQQWYYWFQVVFVLLVTAVGTSIWTRIGDILDSPQSVIFILADSLPRTSNFYMNYVILQWATSILNMLRYVNLLKFLGWKAVVQEERAIMKSEPEDADYYGIGSRGARLTLILVTGMVFCMISPLILVFVFVFFFINRLVYGYLMVFAETKKPDLGGCFWMMQLKHVSLSIPIFVVTMSGCLWSSGSGAIGPGLFTLMSLWLWLYEYSRFVDVIWETLSFRAVVEACEQGAATTDDFYAQDELKRKLQLPDLLLRKEQI